MFLHLRAVSGAGMLALTTCILASGHPGNQPLMWRENSIREIILLHRRKLYLYFSDGWFSITMVCILYCTYCICIQRSPLKQHNKVTVKQSKGNMWLSCRQDCGQDQPAHWHWHIGTLAHWHTGTLALVLALLQNDTLTFNCIIYQKMKSSDPRKRKAHPFTEVEQYLWILKTPSLSIVIAGLIEQNTSLHDQDRS